MLTDLGIESMLCNDNNVSPTYYSQLLDGKDDEYLFGVALKLGRGGQHR